MNPASAIKNRVSLLSGLLIKVMKNPCFYGGFRALCTVVAHLGVPGFLEGGMVGIFTCKDPEAQEGTRWAQGPVTGRWPTWFLRRGVLTARPMFSVFCPLLPQPPLRLRARRSCFSSNSSVLLCQLLSIVVFFFFLFNFL